MLGGVALATVSASSDAITSEEITLRLELGARLRIAYEGEAKHPMCFVRYEDHIVTKEPITRENGIALVLPQGEVTVFLLEYAGSIYDALRDANTPACQVRTVTLAAGVETRLTFAAPPR